MPGDIHRIISINGKDYTILPFKPRSDDANNRLRKVAKENKENFLREPSKIKEWVSECKFYNPNSNAYLTKKNVVKLFKLKNGDRTDPTEDESKYGNLLTFIAPCRIYYGNDGQDLSAPIEVAFYNWTYPEFDRKVNGGLVAFDGNKLAEWVPENLNQMIEVNIQAVNEFGKWNKKVPFILNLPNAFFHNLSDDQKSAAKNAIVNAFVAQIKKQKIDNIDQFIVNGGESFWGGDNVKKIREACKTINKPVNIGSFDFISLAEAYKKEGIVCPLPLMGHPTRPIGNGAFGSRGDSAAEEFFTRATGAGLYHVVKKAINAKIAMNFHADLNIDKHQENFIEVKAKIQTAKDQLLKKDVKYRTINIAFLEEQGEDNNAYKSVTCFIDKSKQCLNAPGNPLVVQTTQTPPSTKNIENAVAYNGLALEVTGIAIDINAGLLKRAEKALKDGNQKKFDELQKMIKQNFKKIAESHKEIGAQQKSVERSIKDIVGNTKTLSPSRSPYGAEVSTFPHTTHLPTH